MRAAWAGGDTGSKDVGRRLLTVASKQCVSMCNQYLYTVCLQSVSIHSMFAISIFAQYVCNQQLNTVGLQEVFLHGMFVNNK